MDVSFTENLGEVNAKWFPKGQQIFVLHHRRFKIEPVALFPNHRGVRFMSSSIGLLFHNYVTMISNAKITIPLLYYVFIVPIRYFSLHFRVFRLPSFLRRILLWSPIVKVRDREDVFLARASTRESLVMKTDWEWDHLEDMIEEGDVALDLGANIGGLAVKIARKVGPEGRMLAVEPNPLSFALLVRNLRLNDLKNAMALKIAVSDKTGDSLLIANLLEPQRTRVQLPTQSQSNSSEKVIRIKTMTIDSIVSRYLGGCRVNVCKFDIEGAEFLALKGSPAFLQTPGLKLWIEVHEPRALANEIDALLKKEGFNTQRIRTINFSFDRQFENMRGVYILARKRNLG